jgi:phage portal protein BeeE
MLMEYGRATWGNAEEMGQQFLNYTLIPWIKRWQGELWLKLFSPEERTTYFAEFLTDDLLRADFTKRMEGYATAIASRMLSPNEARAAENRAPYAGGDRFENPNVTTGTNPANDNADTAVAS